jgi:hypothetical protein
MTVTASMIMETLDTVPNERGPNERAASDPNQR